MIAVVLAIAALTDQHRTLVLALIVAAVGFGGASCHSAKLAGRNRVGADSEGEVRHRLQTLQRQGWDVSHGVGWPGGGDIDHLVRSPSGLGFAIETKTKHFTEGHLRRTVNAARWAAGKRRRYPHGVVPVLCVVRARRVDYRNGEVLIVSADRLPRALRNQAGAPSPAPNLSAVDRR